MNDVLRRLEEIMPWGEGETPFTAREVDAMHGRINEGDRYIIFAGGCTIPIPETDGVTAFESDGWKGEVCIEVVAGKRTIKWIQATKPTPSPNPSES